MRRTLCVLIFMAMIAGAVLAVPRLGGVRQGADIPLGDAETVDGIEGATIVTNITIVESNGYTLIRITDNEYILHVQSNDVAAAAALQDIFVHVDLANVDQLIPDAGNTVLAFSNEVEDTGSDWDPVLHQFNVPVNGRYRLKEQVMWTGALLDGGTYTVEIFTNNSQVVCQERETAAGAAGVTVSGDIEISLTTNHIVQFACNSGGTSDSAVGIVRNTYGEIRLVKED